METPDKNSWGPAMAALPNDFWRACALAFVEGGGGNGRGTSKGYSEALRQAGYKGTENGTNSRGHQIFHDRRMLDALQELVREEMKLGAPIAKRTMIEIMRTPGHKDQFNAAKAVLDRAGIVEQVEIKKTVEHTMSPEMVHKLAVMAKSLGIDQRKLLGWRQAPAVDAEFVEVQPVADPSIAPDAEIEIPESLRKLLS
jgi:hypothetical protein